MWGSQITKKVYVDPDNNFQRVADRVSIVSITGNLILSVFKLISGIVAHSNAMISDAIHSASDVLSTVVVIIWIRLASKEADKEHPYGHERMKCVATIILAMILFMTGLGIGMEALKNILALVAAVVSIVSKEAMFWYTKVNAARIDSSALLADAWHHRSDAFSSVGALIGIAGARLGFPVMDSIASLVIFVFIIKAAYDIFKDVVNKLVDHSCDEETERQIYEHVMRNEAVMGIKYIIPSPSVLLVKNPKSQPAQNPSLYFLVVSTLYVQNRLNPSKINGFRGCEPLPPLSLA